MSDELAAATIHHEKPVELVTLTELPETPSGWTKHMAVHYNYGSKGGAATYTIRDEQGRQTNVGYGYDTRKSKECPRGESGFFVNGSELMSWAELRRRFTELTQANRAGVK
jgi:hypothetical protein